MMNITMWKKIVITIFAIYVAITYFISSHQGYCVFILEHLGYRTKNFCYHFEFLPYFLLGLLFSTILIVWEDNLTNTKIKYKFPVSKLAVFRIVVLLSGLSLLLSDIEYDAKSIPIGLLCVIFIWSFFANGKDYNEKMKQDVNITSKKEKIINGISKSYKNKSFTERQKDNDELTTKIIKCLIEFEKHPENSSPLHKKVIHLSFTSKKVIVHYWGNYSFVLKDGKRTVAHFDSELDSVVLDNILDDDDLPLAFGMSLAYRAFINDTYRK